MQLKMMSIAAAVALALAGAAQAADNAKVDRKAMKAEKDKVEATYKADKAKCKDMQGNAKDVCEADAKGKENVAKAELEQKYAKADSKGHRTAATGSTARSGATQK